MGESTYRHIDIYVPMHATGKHAHTHTKHIEVQHLLTVTYKHKDDMALHHMHANSNPDEPVSLVCPCYLRRHRGNIAHNVMKRF